MSKADELVATIRAARSALAKARREVMEANARQCDAQRALEAAEKALTDHTFVPREP